MAKEKADKTVIEPLDKSAIADARKRAEEKAREFMQAELGTLLRPRTEAIAKLVERRDGLLREAAEISADIDRLEGEVSEILGEPKRKATRGGGGSGGRKQRTPRAELEKSAAQVLDFLKAKGKQGASAAEIKGKFANVNFGNSVAQWVAKFGGVKLKHEGSKKEGIYMMP